MPHSTFMLWRVPEGERNWKQVIAWWELRRIPYNLFLVVCAVFAVIVFAWLTGWAPNLFLALPLGFVAANLCYTGGWVVELLARAQKQRSDLRFAPIAMKSGLLFSLAVFVVPLLLLLGMRIISGEPLTPMAAVTRSEPAVKDLVGTYVVADHDWYEEDWSKMAVDSIPSLTLNADGSFTFRERFRNPTTVFPSEKLEPAQGGMYSGEGTWHTTKIDYGWVPATWELSLDFEQPIAVKTNFILCNQEPPYEIYVILGDPDDWEGVLFERISEQ